MSDWIEYAEEYCHTYHLPVCERPLHWMVLSHSLLLGVTRWRRADRPGSGRFVVLNVIKVSDKDRSHFTGTTESRERNGYKYESSDDCRKLKGTVWT